MTTDLLKPELSFLNFMDLAHKNVWTPFSHYSLQLHMDFPGFKWLISFCACSFQISISMFIFLYRLAGGDDHCDQRGQECLKCFCDTFDSDRCMNSLTRGWMSICSRSMIGPPFLGLSPFGASSAVPREGCLVTPGCCRMLLLPRVNNKRPHTSESPTCRFKAATPSTI